MDRKRRDTIMHSRSSSISSRLLNKRTVAFDAKVEKPSTKKPTVQVFDNNVDVTPRSLLGTDLTALSKAAGNKSVMNFNDSTSVVAPDLLNQSMFGASTFQASYATGFSKSLMSSMRSSRTSLDSVTDEITEPIHLQHFSMVQQEIEQQESDLKETLTDADLDKMVNITLKETETICLLDIPGISVSTLDENIEAINEQNKKYENLCANRKGNDMYVQRGMQTFNNALKSKEMQTIPVDTTDTGCMATNWDLYDTYNRSEEIEDGDEAEDDFLTYNNGQKKSQVKSSTSTNINTSVLSRPGNMSMSLMTESITSLHSSSSVIVEGSDEGGDTATVTDTTTQMDKIMKSDSFKENLFIMERTVVQNQYHPKQAAYRGLSDLKLFPMIDNLLVEEEEATASKIGPNLTRLWSYECSSTRGLTATCIVLNKYNHDLVAIGYSKNGFMDIGKGLICIWSIKNPEYPERIYSPSCAVTALAFSSSSPYLLAAGLFNGTIVLYNIRKSVDKSVLDSVNSSGKHSAPIWQLEWVERDRGHGEERGEVLVSSSGDGRITQWSIRKGFEFADLMKLKRVNNVMQSPSKKPGGSKKNDDAFISRYTSGMCFDFNPSDRNIYLAGTEDGHIHRCSYSYNEQYLETYSGHRGPVYRILWSPFDNDIFLTCSADWSVRLWHVDKLQPVLTLQASSQAVIDVDWSPMSPVLIAAINEQQVEIWDLSSSTLDPLTVHLSSFTNVKLTSVKFALNSKSLLVGDSDGHVTIFQLNEMNLDDEDQNLDMLSKIVESNLLESSAKVTVFNEETDSKNEFVDR